MLYGETKKIHFKFSKTDHLSREKFLFIPGVIPVLTIFTDKKDFMWTQHMCNTPPSFGKKKKML